jgi:hypothetical protein
MSIVITAVARGNHRPSQIAGTERSLPNGDFTIHPNPGTTQTVGDGVNEQTTWIFDFNDDLNYRAFGAGPDLVAAPFVLVLVPKGPHLATDSVKIENLPGLRMDPVSLPGAEDYPVGRPFVVQFDLIRDGHYNPEDVVTALEAEAAVYADLGKDAEGVKEAGQIAMRYEEDAIVCFATLTLVRNAE